MSVITVALAALSARLLWPLSEQSTLDLFYGAVMVSAWWGGMRQGLLAAALSVFVEDYFFIFPYYAFGSGLKDSVRLGLFVAISLLISSLIAARKRAEHALRESQAELEILNRTRCPLCGAQLTRSQPSIPGRVRCQCGMVYRPGAQPALSDGQFWDFHDYTDRVWMERRYGPRRQSGRQAVVDRVSAAVPSGRWLDIGCGPGYLLKEVADAGWQAFGIDLSAKAVGLAKEVGLEVVCGSFPEEAPAGQFDVISILYTMEYFEDPKSTLAECRQRLAPGGVMVLQLKNFAFWQHAERYYRTDAEIWCPHDSRSYTAETITALLHMTGFGTVQAFPAELPERPLITAGFTLLRALRGPLLSPSLTVIARASRIEAGGNHAG